MTTNLINGKIYIGQHQGKNFDSKYYGTGRLIKQTIKKYGIENFSCKILHRCDSKSMLNIKEIYYIKKYKSRESNIGYNLAIGGLYNPMTKRKHTKKSKKKIGSSRIGYITPIETKIKISNTLMRHKVTKEARSKISKKQLGRESPMKGKHHTDKAKKLLREYNLGKHLSKETINKISKKNTGKKRSIEFKERIRKIKLGNNYNLGSHRTMEQKKRMSEAQKRRFGKNNEVV